MIGAPPGFTPGESWTFPLVDPLAHEPVIVPVTIGGKGPFLFIVDPTADTSVDVGVIPQIPTVGNGPYYAPLVDVQVGTLHIDSLPFAARPGHAFDTAERRIAGVLGREVLTSSLVFGFSRDEGIAWLATPKHARKLHDARAIDYYFRKREDSPAYRPLVAANIAGHTRELQIDLGRMQSRLRQRFWDGLAIHDESRTVIDEYGESHASDRVALAKSVDIGGVERFDITFVEYENRHVLADELDGALALDALWNLDVAISFDAHRLYVAPRQDVARATRIARWGRTCKHIGCAELVLHGRDLEVLPEQTPAQLVVRAIASSGAPLPTLEVDLHPGVERFAVELPDGYVDAVLDVIDASPFPRTCIDAKGCVVPYQP